MIIGKGKIEVLWVNWFQLPLLHLKSYMDCAEVESGPLWKPAADWLNYAMARVDLHSWIWLEM